MSDLISRSDVLELQRYSFGVSMLNSEEYIKVSDVDNILTAYDIDRVVEELEKLADENYKAYCIAFNSDDRAEYDAYTNAIEIVKQGGVSDDVCEWELEDEEANLYLTGCQQRQLIFEGTPKENGYRYCPYCGKKIKVVE